MFSTFSVLPKACALTQRRLLKKQPQHQHCFPLPCVRDSPSAKAQEHPLVNRSQRHVPAPRPDSFLQHQGVQSRCPASTLRGAELQGTCRTAGCSGEADDPSDRLISFQLHKPDHDTFLFYFYKCLLHSLQRGSCGRTGCTRVKGELEKRNKRGKVGEEGGRADGRKGQDHLT